MSAVIDVLSLFPEAVRAVVDSSILRRAQAKGMVELNASDLRAFATDRYGSVDDSPFGGQQGMLFTYPILHAACAAQLAQVDGDRKKLKVVYPSPRGVRLEQPVMESLAKWLLDSGGRIAVVCGRYEGVDERFIDEWVDMELSLGDFILTGGELPALALVDGIVRLLPGVLGNDQSAGHESFSNGLLEYPQYTKPREFRGRATPAPLLSGHHKQIADWKLRQSILLTFAFRPDLIEAHSGEALPAWAQDLLDICKKRLADRPKP